uniref:Cytochrome b n=1 Tax=Cucullaea labiata TaxID=142556 RepID=A0A141AX70_9BIVA|nr:cytochrome b [Cucullaea labiata]
MYMYMYKIWMDYFMILWNFGSLLGACLISQIVTGLILVCHYVPHADMAFDSVVHIMRDVSNGWLVRLVHANGASMFFVCMYVHIGRGLYYGSYLSHMAWNVGVVMLVVAMAVAFMGYVLPWGQMSFWGASVITSLFSAVPYIGEMLVHWLWGGFTVCNATLQRFFMFHFMLPFVLVFLSGVHLVFLHETGGSNPLGVTSESCSVSFHPFYTWKDVLGAVCVALVLGFVCFFWPFGLMDPMNFSQANSMVTPPHIQPEWYFLFAYTILRAVPNKVGGVAALAMSVLVLFIIPFIHLGQFRGLAYYPINQLLYWFFICNFVFLSWLGACSVEEPYVWAGRFASIFYFMYFFLNPVFMWFQDIFVGGKDWEWGAKIFKVLKIRFSFWFMSESFNESGDQSVQSIGDDVGL